MKLRIKVPFAIAFSGREVNMLQPTTTFEHDGTIVSLSFDGFESQTSNDLPEDERAFRFINSAVFEMRRQDARLEELCAADRHIDLVRFLIPIVNRFFRAVRNFGTAAHVNELRLPTEEEAVSLLRAWDAEIANEPDVWVRLVEPLNAFARMLAGVGSPPLYQFKIASWRDVDEAIQDDLSPGPEQEFLANSIQYLRAKNYRTALLEAVVCLEIVTSQFLQNYLRDMGLSANRIERVLTKEIGLTSRIGLLLELILRPDEKGQLLDNVLTAVNWRNTIVHRTGNLPPNIQEQDVGTKIRSVLSLALVLAHKRDQILSTPEAKNLATELNRRWNGLSPTMSSSRRHHWLADLTFSLGEEFPTEQRLAAMVEDLGDVLREHDARFVAGEHLFVRFSQLGTTIYVWSEGQLRRLATPIAPLRLPDPPPPIE